MSPIIPASRVLSHTTPRMSREQPAMRRSGDTRSNSLSYELDCTEQHGYPNAARHGQCDKDGCPHQRHCIPGDRANEKRNESQNDSAIQADEAPGGGTFESEECDEQNRRRQDSEEVDGYPCAECLDAAAGSTPISGFRSADTDI